MKYRFPRLFILLFSIPIFSACYKSLPQSLPLEIALPQTPTLTGTTGGQEYDFVTPSSTPDQNSVAEITPTQVLSSTEATTFNPTIQSTPTLAVTLPPIPADPSIITLTHPAALTLAHIQLSRSSQILYSNTPIDALLYPAYHDILDYEWKHSYTPGVDFDQILAIIPNFYDHSQGRLTENMLKDVIGDFVVAKLNEQTYPLEDRGTYTLTGFSGRSYRVEIDGDPLSEWLIHIQNPDGYYLGEDSFWVTLDQGDENQYLRLENEVPWQYGFSSVDNPRGVIADLTGDGLTDIAISDQTPLSSGAFQTIHIAKGSAQGFSIITPSIEIETSDLPDTSTTVYEWVLPTEGKLPYLRVETSTQTPGWPCQIMATAEYHWAGAEFQAIDSTPQIPVTTSCAIAQALQESSASNYPGAIQWLETALEHPSDSTAEVQVFILYRLALNHLLGGQNKIAEIYLDRIGEVARSGSTAIAPALNEQIETLQADKSLTAYRLCQAAESLVTIDKTTPWDPVRGIKTYAYTGFQQGYPTPLCDTYQLQIAFLNARFPNPQASFPTELKADGFPFLYALDLYSSDSDIYWMVITQDDDPHLLVSPNQTSQEKPGSVLSFLGNANGRWEVIFSTPLGDKPLYNLTDLTGDGVLDLGFAQPALNPDWNPCETNQIPYDLFVISAIEKRWLIPFSDAVCLSGGGEPEFPSILADADHDGVIDIIAITLKSELFDLRFLAETQGPISIPPNWHKLLYRTANIDYLLTELTNRLLSATDLVPMRKDIDLYLNRWQKQDELERYLQAQLTYLSALQCEMTGDFENAQVLFYQVWEAYPDTIWANLASTRLDS